MNKLLTISALIISTLVLIGTNYLLNETDDSNNNADLCHFQNSMCTQIVKNSIFSVSVEPKIIKAESEIIFDLLITSDKAVNISSAWLEGKDMFMGKIPLFFAPDIITEVETLAKAQTMIGSCTEESMIWVMNIVVDIDGESILIQFYFESER